MIEIALLPNLRRQAPPVASRLELPIGGWWGISAAGVMPRHDALLTETQLTWATRVPRHLWGCEDGQLNTWPKVVGDQFLDAW